MQLANIISCRAHESWLSYDLVFEWEDIMAEQLAIPIIDIRPANKPALLRRFQHHRYVRRLRKLFRHSLFGAIYNKLSSQSAHSLIFDLYTQSDPFRAAEHKLLPVLVDFWKNVDLNRFYAAYRACDLVLVSSLEAYNYLLQQGCPLNIVHFPLSLPDTYRLSTNVLYPKRYDIILAGRTNDVLLSYLDRYTVQHPHVEILRRVSLNDEFYYVSNLRGLVGKVHTRDEYTRLLRASKIAFYSTPGIDGGEARTGGFNPVTPRFLEMLSAQCLLLGRYPDNEETRFYDVASVCPNVTSYEQFEQIINEYLLVSVLPLKSYETILEQHYTSRRVQQLQTILAQ